MNQTPAEMPKIPKEGDTFKVPNVDDDGELIGWHDYTILTVVYDYDKELFGVIPEGNPDTTYEIVWDTDSLEEPGWLQDGALG